MNSFPVPFKIVATTLLTSLLAIIGILNLRDRINWTDPTDGVFWVESDQGIRAEEVKAGGPGEQAGIHRGDLLISFNGKPISNLGEYYDHLYGRGAGAAVAYLVRSGSEAKTLSLELTSKVLLTPRDGLKTLVAFLHLAIGLFVMVRGGRQPRAFHFYLICLAAFVAYLYSWTPRLAYTDWMVYWISLGAFLVLPALFAHFCLRFPVDDGNNRGIVMLLYGPALALGFTELLWITGHLAGFGLPRTGHSRELLDRAELFQFAIGFLVGGGILSRRWATARDLTTRQQMKWLTAGTLAGIVPFTLIYVIPVLAGARENFAIESSLVFLGLIPLAFSYAIIHYRLMDVESIVRRSAAYFIASSTLLACYISFVLVLGKGLQWVAPDAHFVVICIGVLGIALFFAPLRNRIQSGLDRFFYKEQFDDRTSLLEFARTLSSEISLAPLSRTVLERLSKTFRVDKAALFLADPVHHGFFRLAEVIGQELATAHSEVYREDELLDDSAAERVSAEAVRPLHRANPRLMRGGFRYMLDLRLRGRRIGIIGMGQLPRDKHFSTEDLELMSALAGYAAIALENANLYRSVENKALELERLQIYTENIIESINVAVLALDLNGKVSSCNRAFEELYQVRRDHILGGAVEELFAKDVITSIRKATGTIGWELKTASNIFKLFVENRVGRKLIVNVSIIPLLDLRDVNSGCLVVLDDVTAKIRLEDQLLQAEKLSSIGLLAAGIAHEVNTPITGISSYTQMLLKETPETDRRKPILEKIEKQTFRAAEIVNGLLNFARMNGSEYTDLDVNQLIRESLSLLDHQMRNAQINLKAALDESVPSVFGNSGKLQQVFINLFLNARDAMPSGGELRIETSLNDSMVIVDIKDSGVGISEENIKRIYDPFFTTKSIGKGTGLGLAVTYGIIQEHGGRIFVDSTPGNGTHFTLKLPTRQLRKTAS